MSAFPAPSMSLPLLLRFKKLADLGNKIRFLDLELARTAFTPFLVGGNRLGLFATLDQVLQLQLALFQARDLQLIDEAGALPGIAQG